MILDSQLASYLSDEGYHGAGALPVVFVLVAKEMDQVLLLNCKSTLAPWNGERGSMILTRDAATEEPPQHIRKAKQTDLVAHK